MQKIGARVHSGLGVNVLDTQRESKLRSQYQNGDKCGQLEDSLQLQRYISNPLLLNGCKFDFRTYMLIASTNPPIAYFNTRGWLYLSLERFDPKAKKKSVHVSNTRISDMILNKLRDNETWNGMTKKELQDNQCWSLEQLQDYLLKIGKINDPNWLENNLKMQMKRTMIHVLNMTKHAFLKRSNTYQVVGVDFIIDDNLKLWFIEANAKPGYGGALNALDLIDSQMIKDNFEIMFAYLRSRMKRIIDFMNELTDRVGTKSVDLEGAYPLKSYKEDKERFERINQNYLEPGFQISAKNGFVKIIDENKSGIERYSGLISETCL